MTVSSSLLTLLCGVAVLALLATWVRGRRRLAQLDRQLDATRQIVDLGNDAVLVADLVHGQILYANAAASRLLGQDAAALGQKRLPQLHPPEMVQRSAEVIADVWEKGGLIYTDLPFVRADGSRVDVEISANVVEFQGQPALLVFARDIRRRLEAQAKISDYAARLEQTNRELREMQAQLVQQEKMAVLGTLAAGVAHELNTPIGSISANSDVAKRALQMLIEATEAQRRGLPPGDRRLERALSALQQTCAINEQATQRIAAIVRSLGGFARLDESTEKAVDLHEGIEDTLTLLQHDLHGRIEVLRDFGDLPPLRCNPGQLNQVFMNLMANATQAIDGHGRITVSSRCDGDRVVLRFADTGRGIAPEHLGSIFDPGFTTKGGGLSICYHIIEQHRGTIEVDSAPGRGCTVTLFLPLERQQASPPSTAPAGRSTAALRPTVGVHASQEPPGA
jgi:PAS domain S-box-containing protein